MFQWMQSLSVGDDMIDGQHQTFILKINELAEAGRNKGSEIDIQNLIEFLANYARHVRSTWQMPLGYFGV